MTINGTAVDSGVESGPIDLTAGTDTTIPVVVTAEDGSTTKSYSVTVTRLVTFRASAVALSNTGGTFRRLENGDSIVFTFSQAVDKATVGTCGVTTDSGTDLYFTNVAYPTSDSIHANGTSLTFGSITTDASTLISGSDVAQNSTCAWSAGDTVLTITLQGVVNTSTGTQTRTATWAPAAAIKSATGESIDTSIHPAVTADLF